MNRPKLLITGINGLVGSILREGLGDSYDLCGLDRAGSFSAQVMQADISDYQQVRNVFEQFAPLEYVIHLAGDARANASWDSVLSSNIVGTRNVYEAAREFDVRRVVFASSNHVTGAYEGFGTDLHLHTQNEPKKILPTDPVRPDADFAEIGHCSRCKPAAVSE